MVTDETKTIVATEQVPTSRPLTECFLLAQYEPAGTLPAVEGAPQGTRHAALMPVRMVAPFLRAWLGDLAIKASTADGKGPVELYGGAGLALHFEGKAYDTWPKSRAAFLRRLQCAHGFHVPEDAPIPRVTRFALRYVDIWRAATLDSIRELVQWPIDAAMGSPIIESRSVQQISVPGSLVEMSVERQMEPVAIGADGSGPQEIVAWMAITVEMGPFADAGEVMSRERLAELLDFVHASSKLLLWNTMTPFSRRTSGLFDDDELARFPQDVSDAGTTK